MLLPARISAMLIFQSYMTLIILVALGLGLAILFTAAARLQRPKVASTEMGKAWWVEVTTRQPDCTYYFGPFADSQEAQQAEAGYIQDLRQEGPQEITAEVKWCRPQQLTICQEEDLPEISLV
jgi:hypothetical protein